MTHPDVIADPTVPLVYLAGPIHHLTDDRPVTWRQHATAHLGEHGIRTWDPLADHGDLRGYEHLPGAAQQIVESDKQAVEHSDLVLVDLTHGHQVPCIGTSMEILWAWLARIPVHAIWPHPGHPSPWLHYHATVHPSVDACLAAITAQFVEWRAQA